MTRQMTAGQMRAAAGVPEVILPEPIPGESLALQQRVEVLERTLSVILSELEVATPATLEAAVNNAIGMIRAVRR